MTRSGECVVSAASGGAAVGEGEDLVPFLAEQLGDHLHHGQVVINQQDFGHGRDRLAHTAPARASRNLQRLPRDRRSTGISGR